MKKTIIAGFGGQGVLFIGQSLAKAAMHSEFHTTYLPSYGAEVRGGTANCTVVVSDEEIASPVASEPDYVIAMNNPSLLRFQTSIAPGGVLFVNQDLVDDELCRKDLNIVKIPCVTIANEIKNPKGANVVILGTFIKHTQITSLESVEKVIRKIFAAKSEALADLNAQCLAKGYEYSA